MYILLFLFLCTCTSSLFSMDKWLRVGQLDEHGTMQDMQFLPSSSSSPSIRQSLLAPVYAGQAAVVYGSTRTPSCLDGGKRGKKRIHVKKDSMSETRASSIKKGSRPPMGIGFAVLDGQGVMQDNSRIMSSCNPSLIQHVTSSVRDGHVVVMYALPHEPAGLRKVQERCSAKRVALLDLMGEN